MTGAVDAVVVAGGRGARFGVSEPKQFQELGGRPVLLWSLEALGAHSAIGTVVAVVPSEVAVAPPGWLSSSADEVVAGGESRSESVAAGLAAAGLEAETILVHDGVRPFVSQALLDRLIAAAAHGPVIPVIAITDTVKRVDGEQKIVETVGRGALRLAQTPQAFPAALLRELYSEGGRPTTDDAALCEAHDIEVATVEGDPLNLKITRPPDLEYARWLIESGVLGPAVG